MKQADVLVFVEHAARELDIACALRHVAARRHGLRVEVASLTYGWAAACDRWRPRVAAVPYFASAADWRIRDVMPRLPGARWVNLAYEQLLSKGNEAFKRPKDETARRRVTHLAAGDFFRRFLVRHGVAPENVRVVGSLPCQLYRPPYRDRYAGWRRRAARRFGLDPRRPWVLFPENYGAAFFSDEEVEDRVRRGGDRQQMLEYREFARRCFRAAMRWCAAAARAAAAELILRPRPSTSQSEFAARFARAAGGPPSGRLRIIKDGAVRQWILASDLVVSSYSTSLIEAAVAGKPAVMVSPFPLPESVRVPWNDLAPQVATEQQFVALVQDVFAAPPAERLAQWARRTLLSAGDAIANAADVLALVCGRSRREPDEDKASPRPAKGSPTSSWWASVRAAWRPPRRPAPSSARDPRHEDDWFTPADVRRATRQWRRVLDQPGAARRRAAG